MQRTKIFNFPTLEHAWAGLNEYLANEQEEIEKYGGGIYGTEMVLYHTIVKVDKAWISPEFDFAHILGYTNRKWIKLIRNYVDLNYLDLVRAAVLEREKKKATNYTQSMHFVNNHASGKDCLISLTFTRAIGNPNPVVVYHTRACECTKRVIFDFLLIQRICEYVYGKEVLVEVIMFIPYMFISVEGFLLYTNYKPLSESITNHKTPNPYQKRILEAYKKFMNINIDTIKYKVHARSAKGIQRDENGKPLHGRKAYKAKDIVLDVYKKAPEKDIAKLNKDIL